MNDCYMRAAAFIAVATLFGCGPVPEIDWSNYHPEVQERIDHLALERDCQALQSEFDLADRNSDAQLNRTGRGNVDLMAYIEDKLTSAGCHG